MISPEGQKICLETIYAVPVIDASLIDSDVKHMVADLDVSSFSVISNGSLGDAKNIGCKYSNAAINLFVTYLLLQHLIYQAVEMSPAGML